MSCGGSYTANTGSFHTPGWPDFYPLDFRCEWLIQPLNATGDTSLSLTVDNRFGVHGRDPCTTDYLQFHDGNTTDAPSLGRYCNLQVPDIHYATTSQAVVVFQASTIPHLPSRVGAKVTYQLFELGMYMYFIHRYLYVHTLYIILYMYMHVYASVGRVQLVNHKDVFPWSHFSRLGILCPTQIMSGFCSFFFFFFLFG